MAHQVETAAFQQKAYNPALANRKKFTYDASFLYHCGHKTGNFQTVFLILYMLYMYSADFLNVIV